VNLPSRAVLSLIGAYQRWISPSLLPACKFRPTCSEYAAEAVARHGVFVGTGLAMWRLLRCNPLSRGGLDFVPEHIFRHKADVPPALILPGQRN
jgi:putative membrane protein insertion efficiency factor